MLPVRDKSIPTFLNILNIGDDVKGMLTMAHSFSVISHEYYFGTVRKIKIIYHSSNPSLCGKL